MRNRLLAVILSVVMIATMLPATTLAVPAYEDTKDHWAESSIARWTQAGIINGTDTNGFNPNGEMTRAEAAAVFARLFGLTEKADVSGYSDLGDAWYTDYIALCVAAGIMNGVGEDK